MTKSRSKPGLLCLLAGLYLEDGRLDALSDLVADVDVAGHFSEYVSPKGWLLGTGPADGRRWAGCGLQCLCPGAWTLVLRDAPVLCCLLHSDAQDQMLQSDRPNCKRQREGRF